LQLSNALVACFAATTVTVNPVRRKRGEDYDIESAEVSICSYSRHNFHDFAGPGSK
jgi:hypothetical protein